MRVCSGCSCCWSSLHSRLLSRACERYVERGKVSGKGLKVVGLISYLGKGGYLGKGALGALGQGHGPSKVNESQNGRDFMKHSYRTSSINLLRAETIRLQFNSIPGLVLHGCFLGGLKLVYRRTWPTPRSNLCRSSLVSYIPFPSENHCKSCARISEKLFNVPWLEFPSLISKESAHRTAS